MNVWYVHPYAGGPGVGRYWRPYYFSKFWNQAGHRSVIISAGYHHLLEPDEKRSGVTCVNGAEYAYVPTLRYLGNGVGRMLSMLIFTMMLLPFCLILALKRGTPDAIIYSSPHPFGVVSCWLAARLLGAKFVFEVRDIWPLSLVELGGLKADNPLVRVTGWIERFSYARPDSAVSSSDLVRHVQVLKEQGVFVVIYAGAHGEPNALEGLVRSAGLLRERGASIRIILVGKGECKEQLKAIAAQDASGLVEFFDQQPKETIMAVLKLASAGYISLKSEPIFRFGVSPNKLWDYMLVGLPVIFACKAGNDPVSDYDCGVSADPDAPEDITAAIFRLLLLSEDERRTMGQRGRDAVLEHYTYESLALQVLNALADGRAA